MKKVFSYSGRENLEIYSHKDRFYVKKDDITLLKTDNEQVARAYIDGYDKASGDIDIKSKLLGKS